LYKCEYPEKLAREIGEKCACEITNTNSPDDKLWHFRNSGFDITGNEGSKKFVLKKNFAE